MNVLISAAGRRVRLVQLFREAMREMGLAGRVYASDISPTAPALYAADDHFLAPPASDANFTTFMRHACGERDIRIVVSVNDKELLRYAEARDVFDSDHIWVGVPGPETVRILRNKKRTHAWMQENGLPVPTQWPPDALPDQPPFPLIVKPAWGSAGYGVSRVENREDLEQALRQTDEAVVEECAPGQEFTVNVLVSRRGELVCAIPHYRLEVRSGEVSKGRTFRHPDIAAMARRLVERLAKLRGPLNFQGFLASDGSVRLTEVNPRFGGGYPLAHAAGARFPQWMLADFLGKPVPLDHQEWKTDVVMLRYDHEVLRRWAGPDRLDPL